MRTILNSDRLVNAMEARKVRCREITESDVLPISELLTRGFPGRRRDYWLRGLQRQAARDIPDGYPRFGYLLECEGAPVGVLLLLYRARSDGDPDRIRCNVSSWYVEPEFRNYATLLTSVAQKNKNVTYVNISPAVNTWPIIEAQGFRRYCDGMLFSVPLLSGFGGGVAVEAVGVATDEVAGLSSAEIDLLRSHAAYGCLSLVCRSADGAMPFVLVPKRLRSGRFPFPAMQLVYCREMSEYVACAGAIGRALLRRGRPIVIVDANGPIEGLAGLYLNVRGRKYFKGPHPPRLGDLADSELVLYGP